MPFQCLRRGDSVARGGYETLLGRRRRRERRRRRAFAATVLGVGFAAGVLLVRSTGTTAVSDASRLALPAVAAGVPDGSLLLAAWQPSRRRSKRAAKPVEVPVVVVRPPVPADVLAMLPPSARNAADGSSAWPGSLAQAPLDRVIERSESVGADGARAPVEIEYTVDGALTERVVEVLDEVELGHVIVLDPRDGRVLAYASTEPDTFPPTGIYPTASLMKVVTSAALLRTAPAATQRNCRFIGSPYYLAKNLLDPPSRGRTVAFVDALAISNNQCFAQLAVHELGSDRVVEQMQRFGLLESPGARSSGWRGRSGRGSTSTSASWARGSPARASRRSPRCASPRRSSMASVVTPHWIARVSDAHGADAPAPAAPAPRPALSTARTKSCAR